MSVELPPSIKNAIVEGRAILFLGAAASYGCLEAGLRKEVSGADLRDFLADRFLGGKFKQRSLQAVADFARNEDSLLAVQTAVREKFLPLHPNDFHKLVPTFRWKAIVTTNYDLIVERAYESAKHGLQELSPVTKDGDELERALKGQNTVPYLKLHGCINNHAEVGVPIVLDSSEYLKFSHGRVNLVSTFREWAINHPILFCGYSLSDENIKQILFDIGDDSQARPQYLYVSPGLDEIEIRYWQSKRMAALTSTYEEFLTKLDGDVSENVRKLATFLNREAPSIMRWIPSHHKPSESLLLYLSNEVKHVLPEAPPDPTARADAFFSGLDSTFGPIYAGLDVRRQAVDELLNRVVLDTLKSTAPKFFLLRGYAGFGKSVLTKRLCIEAAGLLDKPLVIYIPPRSVIRSDAIVELQRLANARLYVFFDDLAEYEEDLLAFLERIKKLNVPVSVFANARTNELSAYGKIYAPHISGEFEIGDLEAAEIDELLVRLSTHRMLGPLQQYDEVDRRLFLEKFYNRQLLVALHEITQGASFEEIIVDEFERVVPREAQQIYLDICTLHQCRVHVRSGLVSRLSGIPIAELNGHLLGSLSKVVVSEFDNRVRDFVYRSRHEEISRMVFELAVPTPEQRSLQLCRILSTMDLNYSSDRKAFFDLLKGRRLAELFDHKGLAISVFEASLAADPPLSYVNHQRAILELNHKTGSLELAAEFLSAAEVHVRAEGFSPASILHTKANLLRRRALHTEKGVEKGRYRADARAILKSQLFRRDGSYSETLYSRLLLDEVKDLFAQVGKDAPGAQKEATVRVVNELNDLINEYLLRHPSDPQMTLVKAEFLETLGRSPSAMSLLESYVKKNQPTGPVHKVFVETLMKLGRLEEAEKLLRTAVIATPGDKGFNFMLARLLIEKDEDASQEGILLHLRRSFSDGDSNYDARLLFARCHLLYGDTAKGQEEFVALRKPYIQSRDRVREMVKDSTGKRRIYSGKILSKQAGYAFASSAELRFNVFVNRGTTKEKAWGEIDRGTKILFNLGFTFRGPVAVDLQIADSLAQGTGIWQRS